MIGASRRQFLRALSAGTIALAGCASSQSGDGGRLTSNGTTTSTLTATSTAASGVTWSGPEYGQWLPAPGTVMPAEPYLFWALDLTEFADHLGTLPQNTQTAIDHAWGPLPLDWQTVPFLVMFPGTHVIKTDFDRSGIVDQVTDTDGWSESGGYEGYTLLEKEDGSHSFAVGDEAIVTARKGSEDRPATATVKGVIDTRQGRVARYPGEHPVLDTLIAAFTDGFLRHWRPRAVFPDTPQEEAEFDGQVGLGHNGRFTEGATAAVQLFYVFENADVVDLDAVRTYVDEHSGEGQQFAQWESPEVSQEGRLAVVEGTVTRQLR